jgi:hypothetical protein
MTRTALRIAVLLGLISAVLAPCPGFSATKKLLEYGWDVPRPDFVSGHIAEMEKRPFDGVIFRLAGKHSGNIFSGGKWDVEDYQADFAALRDIKWGKFTDNFLMMYSASEMDWFSDEDWAGVLSNVDLMARAAVAGRCQLAFDAEPYGKNPWSYAEQKHAGEKTFEQYQAIARQRGQQFIEVVQRRLPRGVLVTLFSYSMFQAMAGQSDLAKRQAAFKQHGYGLYYSFLNGMLDGLQPGFKITDGNEASYYYENSQKFVDAHQMMREKVLSLIPSTDVGKFREQTQASQALYVDYIFAKVPWPNILANFMTPEERAQWFEHNVYWALKTSDEYVWLYSEKMNWWTDTDLPPGLEQAVTGARQAVAAGRPLDFDLSERMKAVQQARAKEIASKLARRSMEIGILRGAPSPVIDARRDDAAWKQGTQLQFFKRYFGSDPVDPTASTLTFVAYDATALYVFLWAEEPQLDKMQIVGANHDDAVWNGDSIDIFLTAEESGTPYYHFIINPKNVQWDARHDTDNDMSFDPKWQSATRTDAEAWYAEVAIPWAEVKIDPKPMTKLGLNICRQRIPEHEQSCWSQTVSGFMESDHFGTLILR